jgi:hypothetical protein
MSPSKEKYLKRVRYLLFMRLSMLQSARAVCEPGDIFASSTTNLFSDESYVKLAIIPRSGAVKVRYVIYHVRHPSFVAEDPPIPPK